MSLIRHSAIFAAGTFASRILGYIRDIFIAHYLGTSAYADIYVVAQRFPNLFRRIFAEGAMASAFIPLYRRKLGEDGQNAARHFSGQVAVLLTVILGLLVIVAQIFMPQIISLMMPGYEDKPELLKTAIAVTRVASPYLWLIAIVSLLCAILNSSGRFFSSGIAPAFLNIGLIAAVVMASFITKNPQGVAYKAVWFASYAMVIIGLVQAWWLWKECKDHKVSPFLKLTKPDKTIRKLGKKMLPVALGSSVQQFNLLISTSYASLVAGGISFIYYADRLILLPVSLVGTALGTAILPLLSSKDDSNHHHHFLQATQAALCLALPAMYGYVILAKPIIGILFENGAFDNNSTIMVARCLQLMAIGMAPYILIKVITPIYYAKLDFNTPLWWSICSMVANIALNYYLIDSLGVLAVATSTMIASWVNLLGLWWRLPNMYKLSKSELRSVATIWVVNSTLAVILWLVVRCYNYQLGIFGLVAAIASYMVIYFFILDWLKLLPIRQLLKMKGQKSVNHPTD